MRDPGETAQQATVEKRGARAWLRPRSSHFKDGVIRFCKWISERGKMRHGGIGLPQHMLGEKRAWVLAEVSTEAAGASAL